MDTTTKSRKARYLAKKIATFMVADEAFNSSPIRWIRSEADFTEADKARINELKDKIIDVFNANDGMEWQGVLNGLRELCPVFLFGFKAQDMTIHFLTNYGYSFK